MILAQIDDRNVGIFLAFSAVIIRNFIKDK